MAYAVGTLFAPVLMARYRTDLLVRYSVMQPFLPPERSGSAPDPAGGAGSGRRLGCDLPSAHILVGPPDARRDRPAPSRSCSSSLDRPSWPPRPWLWPVSAACRLSGTSSRIRGTLRVVAVVLMAVAYLAVRLAIGGAEIRRDRDPWQVAPGDRARQPPIGMTSQLVLHR